MSFSGLFLWDIKDGRPTSYSDAQDMETQVSHNASRRCNPAFMAVAKAVEQFTKEAKAYYDDEILNMYSDMTDWMVDFTNPVLSIDHAPEELAIEFSAIIIKAAQEHNLVVLHQEIEVVFLPDGTVLTENTPEIWIDFAKETLAAWAQQLVTLKQENENRDTLPSTSAPLKKLINKIVRARLKEAGITKIKKPEPTVFDVDCGRIQLSLKIFPEIDHLYKIEEGILRVEFLNAIYIYLNDFTQVSEKWHHFLLKTEPLVFYKDNYDIREYKISRQYCNRAYTLAEFENEIDRCVDMMLYFYNACSSLPMLYDTLVADKDDKLSLHKNNYGNYIPKPDVLLIMAKLTKQPDYDKLVTYYRQEYIDYKMNEYKYSKESFERSEQERSERRLEYKKRKFQEMMNPQENFELEIDQLISGLETLDVEAILNTPPSKELDF